MRKRTWIGLITATALGLLVASLLYVNHLSSSSGPGRAASTLVLYCATDREIAQELIDQFEKETGIHVEAKFDTEAAKAVGLVQAIRQEKAHPQCDVLWGGGPLFCTILADEGCLAPAPEDLIAAHGTAPRDPQGRWLGFAAAYRVLIVNTDVLDAGARPHSYRDLTDPRYKGHVGIANPLFGGMAAHVAAIFAHLGPNAGRRWLEELKRNDCAVCAGMADVKNRVASGELWFGITNTDDAYVGINEGKPVVVIFPDQGPGEIGCLEGFNTVALVAGAPHPNEAERLLRFLMTTETEKLLALGPWQGVGMLPDSVSMDVRPAWIPRKLRTMEVDWNQAVKTYPASTQAIKEILLGR
jgi:iron(III) transport system substrate-binding protein